MLLQLRFCTSVVKLRWNSISSSWALSEWTCAAAHGSHCKWSSIGVCSAVYVLMHEGGSWCDLEVVVLFGAGKGWWRGHLVRMHFRQPCAIPVFVQMMNLFVLCCRFVVNFDLRKMLRSVYFLERVLWRKEVSLPVKLCVLLKRIAFQLAQAQIFITSIQRALAPHCVPHVLLGSRDPRTLLHLILYLRQPYRSCVIRILKCLLLDIIWNLRRSLLRVVLKRLHPAARRMLALICYLIQVMR